VPLKLSITFAAGVVSFLSPCVLPLLPGYVAYMSGGAVGERPPLRKSLPGTAAFVAGLSIVFVSLGATASVLSVFLQGHKRALEIGAGIFIVALGLLMASDRGVPFLLRERRFAMRPGVGPARTFLLGAAFAFAWTPCIGPTLGAALNLAATSTGLRSGIALLFAYSLGLGVPFVLGGLGLVTFSGRLKRHSATIQRVGGIVLVAVGFLMLAGRLTLITIWMRETFTRFGLDLWNRV
jgi:cytochrome c-type biogenesis protein